MGSRPSAPVTYRPTPTAPVIYQSVVPEEDFKRASDYVDDLKAERVKKKQDLASAGFGAVTTEVLSTIDFGSIVTT